MTEEKKIKLLFRHRSMEMGGVEKVILSIVENLDPKKFEITVCLNLNQGELRNEIPNHVRKVYLTDGKEDFSKNKIKQKVQLILRKIKLEKLRKNPEIIDSHYLKENYDIEIGMTYNDFESVLQSSNKNSKKVGWFHSEINLPKLQPLVPKILKHFPMFDHMIYCSEKIQTMMHLEYPNLAYPEESVIINAIPIEKIIEKSKEKISDFPEKGPVFISIGRLHSRKGFHKLIDAHEKLINEGFFHQILILGEGEEKENLLKQVKTKKVEETIHFLGNRMNPYPYLKNADFFIMPSESEAWPLVLAEALILKKPCIATDTGDVSTLLENKQTGLLIKYDSGEIYMAMKEFLTNETLVSEIRKNLLTIEKQFDNQKIFNEVEHLFVSILNKTSSSN